MRCRMVDRRIISEASQAMTQYRKGNFARTFNQCTAPSQGSVLQRRRFHHALVSDGRRSAKRRDITEELRTKCNEVLLINQDGPDVNQENGNTNELTSCTDTESLIKHTRKHCMRDQNGEVVPRKRKARARTSVMRSPSITLRRDMGGCSRVTLNVRSLQFGTLTSIFRGPLTFSVDYLEIPGEVRIEASELSSCEWCRARGLPALFLQMTPAACCCRRDWLGMPAGTGASYNCHSKNQEEKYLVIIFESDPTMLEKAALEEILAEIGRHRNVSNFPANLTFEEANNRLMARKHSHIKTMQIPAPFCPTSAQMATISVSDTEDRDDCDNDLMECSPSQTQAVRKLLVYPPPPAKGGFTITEEDLQCLNEGELLNDVIVDFYLKYLVCEKLKKEDGNRCHVFSSFFYRSLTQEDPRKNPNTTGLSVQEKRHNRVKTWTRHLDLFEKDFIFVPINELAHWFLVVICFPGQVSHCSALDSSGSRTESSAEYAPSPCLLNPMSLFYTHKASEQLSRCSMSIGEMDRESCFVSDDAEEGIWYNGTTSGNVFCFGRVAVKQPCILIMDSLGCHTTPALVTVLQEYLEMEWWVRKGSRRSFGKGAMKGWSLQVPQQDNNTDCGLYLLQYAESFITNPPPIFHPAVDLSDWFHLKLVKKKREQIKRLIFRLHHQQLNLGN